MIGNVSSRWSADGDLQSTSYDYSGAGAALQTAHVSPFSNDRIERIRLSNTLDYPSTTISRLCIRKEVVSVYYLDRPTNYCQYYPLGETESISSDSNDVLRQLHHDTFKPTFYHQNARYEDRNPVSIYDRTSIRGKDVNPSFSSLTQPSSAYVRSSSYQKPQKLSRSSLLPSYLDDNLYDLNSQDYFAHSHSEYNQLYLHYPPSYPSTRPSSFQMSLNDPPRRSRFYTSRSSSTSCPIQPSRSEDPHSFSSQGPFSDWEDFLQDFPTELSYFGDWSVQQSHLEDPSVSSSLPPPSFSGSEFAHPSSSFCLSSYPPKPYHLSSSSSSSSSSSTTTTVSHFQRYSTRERSQKEYRPQKSNPSAPLLHPDFTLPDKLHFNPSTSSHEPPSLSKGSSRFSAIRLAISKITEKRKAGEVEQARKAIQTLCKKNPTCYMVWLEASRLEFDLGNIVHAREIIHEGLQYLPGNETLLEKRMKIEERLLHVDDLVDCVDQFFMTNHSRCVKNIVEAATAIAKLGRGYCANRIFQTLLNHTMYTQGGVTLDYVRFVFKTEDYHQGLALLMELLDELAYHGPIWFFTFSVLEHDHTIYWKQGDVISRPTNHLLQQCLLQALDNLPRDLRWKVYYIGAQAQLRSFTHIRSWTRLKKQHLKEYCMTYPYVIRQCYDDLKQSVLFCIEEYKWKVWLLAGRVLALAGQRASALKVRINKC